MTVLAIIDTNVIVSSFLSKDPESPVKQIMRFLDMGAFTVLYSREIFEEYEEVLHRAKFRLGEADIAPVLSAIKEHGIEVEPDKMDASELPDPKDAPFLEVTLSEDGSFLVTGNLKLFRSSPKIVSPREFLSILIGGQA